MQERKKDKDFFDSPLNQQHGQQGEKCFPASLMIIGQLQTSISNSEWLVLMKRGQFTL